MVAKKKADKSKKPVKKQTEKKLKDENLKDEDLKKIGGGARWYRYWAPRAPPAL